MITKKEAVELLENMAKNAEEKSKKTSNFGANHYGLLGKEQGIKEAIKIVNQIGENDDKNNLRRV